MFGWVGAMHIRGRVLDLDLFHCDESFNVVGCLVVQLVDEGMVAMGGEPRIHLRVGMDYIPGRSYLPIKNLGSKK